MNKLRIMSIIFAIKNISDSKSWITVLIIQGIIYVTQRNVTKTNITQV